MKFLTVNTGLRKSMLIKITSVSWVKVDGRINWKRAQENFLVDNNVYFLLRVVITWSMVYIWSMV